MAIKLEYGANPKLAKNPAAAVLKIMPFLEVKKAFSTARLLMLSRNFRIKIILFLNCCLMFFTYLQ